MNTFWVVSSYNNDLEWIKEYTDNYVILNAGRPREGTVQVPNVGYNIHAYMTWIVENYEKLPEVVFFVKDNLLQKYIYKEDFKKIYKNQTFTPMLRKDHKVEKPINFYSEDGMYNENNNSWYFNHYVKKYVNCYKDFADLMGLPNPEYLKFAPGACYIVPKANILRWPIEFYAKLRDWCSYAQLPVEAHCVERALYTIWS